MILERPRVKLPSTWFPKETLNKLLDRKSRHAKCTHSALTRDEKCK